MVSAIGEMREAVQNFCVRNKIKKLSLIDEKVSKVFFSAERTNMVVFFDDDVDVNLGMLGTVEEALKLLLDNDKISVYLLEQIKEIYRDRVLASSQILFEKA